MPEFSRRPDRGLGSAQERAAEILSIVREAIAPYVGEEDLADYDAFVSRTLSISKFESKIAEWFECSSYVRYNQSSVALDNGTYSSPYAVASLMMRRPKAKGLRWALAARELPDDGWPDPVEWRLRNV